jgi:hypothetical protein
LTQRVIWNQEPSTSIHIYHNDQMNSCIFHEHLGLNEKACRERIKDRAQIFPVIIEVCAQEGIAMLKAKEGNA